VRAGNFLRILAVSLALAVYAAWSRGIREGTPAPAALPAVPSDGLPLVRLAEARILWQEPATLFVDVRPAADYRFGHIAGAVQLPEEEFEQRFPALKPRLERARAIVVYCKSRDCGKSLWGAIRLRNEGLSQTRIYPGGWNEWVTGGLPTAGTGR
jgi:rhodanese-related sulfurtransferase